MSLELNSLVLTSVDYVWPLLEVNSTTVHNLYRLWAACPCLQGPQLPCMRKLMSSLRVSLMLMLHSGSSLSLIAGWARDYPRTFNFRKIFKCAHLKFTAYGRKQANIHTCAHAVPLVWGSLRLIPILAAFTWHNKVSTLPLCFLNSLHVMCPHNPSALHDGHINFMCHLTLYAISVA